MKQDFARLMLGLFAASYPSHPLSFKYGAVGEAPEGKADILDVSGPANFSLRFASAMTWSWLTYARPTPRENLSTGRSSRTLSRTISSN